MRARLVAAVVVTSLVASACSGSKPAKKPPVATTSTAAASPTTTAPPQASVTSEAQLYSDIQTQGLTPLRAEQLFALDIGPLPGVSVAGITPDTSFDGTTAVMDLYSEWGQLTQAQRDAATQLTTSSNVESNAGAVSTIPSTAIPTTTAPPTATTTSGKTASSARRGGPPPHAVLDVQLTYDYLDLAEKADQAEHAGTGSDAIGHFVIAISSITSFKTYAETTYYHPALGLNAALKYGLENLVAWPDGCHVTVFESRFATLDAESAAAVMAHEVFHCYQQRREGADKVTTVHPWVQEGESDWVMAQLHPTAEVYAKDWMLYSVTPTKSFKDRGQDGLGVFGHEGDIAGDQATVWHKLLPVVGAAIDGQDSTALSTLLGSDSKRFYDTWGASYFEDQTQADWHMAGPGSAPTTGPPPRSININNDDGQEIGLLDPYQSAQVTITGGADILVVTLASGYGKVHDEGYGVDQTLDNAAPLALCLKSGGCKCPDGSAGASEHTTVATGPISVGLDGGDMSLAAYAAGVSLDRFCKKPDQPPPTSGPAPPAPPGGGGGGGGEPPPPEPPQPGGTSNGDPHLTTFDGRTYDLQAAGEFTLVKSTTDDFVVQVRAVPIAGRLAVAANQAVATEVSGHRVQVALENGSVVARIDGVAVVDEVTTVGQGTLERLGTEAGLGYTIEWPDGTTVRVDQFGLFGVNATVTPAPARRGQLVGLLGNDNGDASDDLANADGTSLGASPSDQTLETVYADSWRITQAASLFDYAPGQSTATFTKPGPSQDVNASNVPDVATVTQECQAEGVTDQYLLNQCIVDASAIHDQAVLSHYAQSQTVLSVRTAIARHLPPFAAPSAPSGPPTSTTPTTAGSGEAGILRTLVDSGRVSDPSEQQTFSFAASNGDVIWIGPPGCGDASMIFSLIDPNDTTLNPADITIGDGPCLLGERFDVKTSGTYRLVANAGKTRGGAYGVPIRFVRPDLASQATYGQTLSGSISFQALHDVYLFSAQVGDMIHIFGQGCDIGTNTWVRLVRPDGTPIELAGATPGVEPAPFFSLNCDQNSSSSEFMIQKPGAYEIVVNPQNDAPGPYHFVLQK